MGRLSHPPAYAHPPAASNFVSVTECSEKVAIDMLKAAEWSVPTAVELYYARGHGPARSGAGRPSLVRPPPGVSLSLPCAPLLARAHAPAAHSLAC